MCGFLAVIVVFTLIYSVFLSSGIEDDLSLKANKSQTTGKFGRNHKSWFIPIFINFQ
jgi:hypothetical protein